METEKAISEFPSKREWPTEQRLGLAAEQTYSWIPLGTFKTSCETEKLQES